MNMLSNGNSNAEITARNLIKTYRGEVPYDRIRGIDGSFTDKPISKVIDNIDNDVRETIEEYEPRADVIDVAVSLSNGKIEIELDIDIVKERLNEYE